MNFNNSKTQLSETTAEQIVRNLTEDSEYQRTHRYLFHLTEKQNIQNIPANGLIPSDSGQRYQGSEPKLFFALGLGPTSVLMRTLGIDNGAVIKIAMDKVPKDITFYHDPEFSGGWSYTTEPIPPEAIEKIIRL